MLMEAITISSILGASAFAVWFVKARFQPEIERSLTKIEPAVGSKGRNDSYKAKTKQRDRLGFNKPTLIDFLKNKFAACMIFLV